MTQLGCLTYAGLSRPMPGESVCGDGWNVLGSVDCATVAVADGVGHGPLAHEASQLALRTVEQVLVGDPGCPLDGLLRICHDALRGTRGAAVALLRLQPQVRRLAFAGVGNVAFTGRPRRRGLGISLPGMVGAKMRTVRVFESELEPGDQYALWSDGVSSRFRLEPDARRCLPDAVKIGIEEHGKDRDDATLVLVRWAAGALAADAAPC